MSSINLPALAFSEWKLWHERQQISGHERGGVYRLAVVTSPTIEIGWDRVRYIGMSVCTGGLSARWGQFQATLIGRKSRHSGARHMHQEGNYGEFNATTSRFGGNPDSKSPRRYYLYVSAMPVGPTDIFDPDEDGAHTRPEIERVNGIIKYLEHEAFAQYCEHSSTFARPKFNASAT